MATGTITINYESTSEMVKICTALVSIGVEQPVSPFKASTGVTKPTDRVEITPDKAKDILKHLKVDSDRKIDQYMGQYIPDFEAKRLRLFSTSQRKNLTIYELLKTIALYVKRGKIREVGSITRDAHNMKIVFSHLNTLDPNESIVRLTSIPFDNEITTPRLASAAMDKAMREVGAIGRNESLSEYMVSQKCSLSTPSESSKGET